MKQLPYFLPFYVSILFLILIHFNLKNASLLRFEPELFVLASHLIRFQTFNYTYAILVSVEGDLARSIENIRMSLVEEVSENVENLEVSLRTENLLLSDAQDHSENVEATQKTATGAIIENGDQQLISNSILQTEDVCKSILSANVEKSSENISLCTSADFGSDRICLLETRKKKKSPIQFMPGMIIVLIIIFEMLLRYFLNNCALVIIL